MEQDLTLTEFKLFQKYIQEKSGIHFEESKLNSLSLSIAARMAICGIENYLKYLEFLHSGKEGEEEFSELLNLITINETSFFRNREHFKILGDRIVPEILKSKDSLDRSLRIWSAGCSTGEEPYSIVITLLELGDLLKDYQIEILATDVNKNALKAAEQGIYGYKTLKELLMGQVEKYFSHQGEKFHLSNRVKRMVGFKYFNLIQEPYPLPSRRGWDIIFCRNVIIYFPPEIVKKVIHNFYQNLVEGGYLFIGPSETLWQISNEFKLVELDGIFVYKKEPLSQTLDKGRKSLRPVEHPVKPSPRFSKRWEEQPAELPLITKSENPFEIYAKGLNLFANNRYEESLKEFAKVLVHDPQLLMAHFLMGYIYFNQKQYDKALVKCEDALRIDPLSSVAHFLLGLIHEKRGEKKEAMTEFKKSLYNNDSFALPHYHLGNLYDMQGNRELALKEYECAIKILENGPLNHIDNLVEFLAGFSDELLIKVCKQKLDKISFLSQG